MLTFAQGRCTDNGLMWTNGRSSQIDTYDLAGDIGPVPLAMPSASPGIVVDTSAGSLAFSEVAGLSFEAQVNEPTVVPTLTETGLLLLMAALAGTGAFATRKPRLRAG